MRHLLHNQLFALLCRHTFFRPSSHCLRRRVELYWRTFGAYFTISSHFVVMTWSNRIARHASRNCRVARRRPQVCHVALSEVGFLHSQYIGIRCIARRVTLTSNSARALSWPLSSRAARSPFIVAAKPFCMWPFLRNSSLPKCMRYLPQTQLFLHCTATHSSSAAHSVYQATFLKTSSLCYCVFRNISSVDLCWLLSGYHLCGSQRSSAHRACL